MRVRLAFLCCCVGDVLAEKQKCIQYTRKNKQTNKPVFIIFMAAWDNFKNIVSSLLELSNNEKNQKQLSNYT